MILHKFLDENEIHPYSIEGKLIGEVWGFKQSEIVKLQKQVETLVSAITLIGGMAGNPDAVEACRNINRVASNALEKIKEIK